MLFTATICGAGVRAPDPQLWHKLIQPLGQGTFQGYDIPGQPREILAPTIAAWRKLTGGNQSK